AQETLSPASVLYDVSHVLRPDRIKDAEADPNTTIPSTSFEPAGQQKQLGQMLAEFDKLTRIYRRVVATDFVVQMRSCRTPAAAHLANDAAIGYTITHAHQDLAQMSVAGSDSIAV